MLNRVPASRWDNTMLSLIIYSELFWPPVRKDGVVLSSWLTALLTPSIFMLRALSVSVLGSLKYVFSTLKYWVQIDRAFIKYTTSMVNAQGWEILKAQAKNSTTYTSIFYTTLIQSEMSMRCVYETFLHCTMLHGGGGGNKSRNSKTNLWYLSAKVIHTKYSKHCPSTVAHTFECVCSKINHGLNHGLFISLLKLINCPIHWIVYE